MTTFSDTYQWIMIDNIWISLINNLQIMQLKTLIDFDSKIWYLKEGFQMVDPKIL